MDIFLNHCGIDTRNTITSILYNYLCRWDTNTFVDDEQVERKKTLLCEVEEIYHISELKTVGIKLLLRTVNFKEHIIKIYTQI